MTVRYWVDADGNISEDPANGKQFRTKAEAERYVAARSGGFETATATNDTETAVTTDTAPRRTTRKATKTSKKK